MTGMVAILTNSTGEGCLETPGPYLTFSDMTFVGVWGEYLIIARTEWSLVSPLQHTGKGRGGNRSFSVLFV